MSSSESREANPGPCLAWADLEAGLQSLLIAPAVRQLAQDWLTELRRSQASLSAPDFSRELLSIAWAVLQLQKEQFETSGDCSPSASSPASPPFSCSSSRTPPSTSSTGSSPGSTEPERAKLH